MRLSIAIVNWNTSSLLEECLRSVAENPTVVEHEIIVVDNASDDFREKLLHIRFPHVNFIVNERNEGYARGNNQAIEKSSGDYVLLLNPDTQITDGALDTLLEFAELREKAAAVAPKLVRPDGSLDRSVRSFPYPGPIAWEYLGLSRLFPQSYTFGRYRMRSFSYNEDAEVDQPMGSCLLLSRAAIDDVGLLDEDFPIFFNEVDWLYRARLKGYKAYYTPRATVIHHGAASTSQAGRWRMIRESHDSLIRFYRKHFRHTLPAPVYYGTILAIKLGVLFRR